MCFKKTCISLMVVSLVLSAGLLWVAPPEGNTADAESGIPPALIDAQRETQKTLESLNASLEVAARDLAKEGSLNSPQVHSILGKLCADNLHGYVVDCCTVDAEGRIVAIEPEIYKAHESADISKQEQVVRLHQTRQPVLSLNMPMVEGFDAVDLEWPIIGGSVDLKGSVSLLIRPEVLIEATIRPMIEGLPVDIWVMEKNGRILYDIDKDAIGRDLFTDPVFKPYAQLLAVGKRIADEPTGSGFYEFSKEGSADIVRKHAHWTTVGLHGTDWRIVMVQAIAGDQPVGASVGNSTSVASLLRVLAGNAGLRKSLAAGDEQGAMRILEQFHRANPGLYSIQWIDANGVNRFGYPAENSLRNYDMRVRHSTQDRKFMEVVDSKKEATLDLPLLEGNRGMFYLAPVMGGKQYLGIIYVIRLKTESK